MGQSPNLNLNLNASTLFVQEKYDFLLPLKLLSLGASERMRYCCCTCFSHCKAASYKDSRIGHGVIDVCVLGQTFKVMNP